MDSADKLLMERFGTTAVNLQPEMASIVIAWLISELNSRDIRILQLEAKVDELKLKRKKKAIKEFQELTLKDL